jgi:hypothetical protein
MPGLSRITLALAAIAALAAPACEQPKPPPPPPSPPSAPISSLVIAAARETKRPPFAFSSDDEKFLEEVQRGCFNFLWSAGDPSKPGHATGMAPDRTSKPTVSVAGVGFQLSALCIGVERGWISRSQGQERAQLILRKLTDSAAIKKAGLFYHFIDADNAGQPHEAYEHVVSTIDSSLLFAGILTASQYFGGEVQKLGDAIFEDANWKFFLAGPRPEPFANGFITLGWKPADIKAPTGDGELLPYAWIDCGDEHRLVTFLAVCAPKDENRVDPKLYYKLRRSVGEYKDGPFIWFPWSGALFTAFFSHCWIDYAHMGPDDASAFQVNNRPRVDWWENTRRTALMHRRKCTENPLKLPTLGENAWGLTASDVKDGYAVPGLFPNALPMPGALPQVDFPIAQVKDNYGDGTIAPYGPGSCIMFEPDAALAALKHIRSLKKQDGAPLTWSDPATGGYGFFDAFNLGNNWASPDCLSIDQGPLLLAIENARTGLIWKTFHAHPFVQAGMKRLKLSLNAAPPNPPPAPAPSK